jgi:predicted RNase H-like nuclease (RuvC/YqgF family)
LYDEVENLKRRNKRYENKIDALEEKLNQMEKMQNDKFI